MRHTMDTDRKGQSKREVRIICHRDGTQARHICTVNSVGEPDTQLLEKNEFFHDSSYVYRTHKNINKEKGKINSWEIRFLLYFLSPESLFLSG